MLSYARTYTFTKASGKYLLTCKFSYLRRIVHVSFKSSELSSNNFTSLQSDWPSNNDKGESVYARAARVYLFQSCLCTTGRFLYNSDMSACFRQTLIRLARSLAQLRPSTLKIISRDIFPRKERSSYTDVDRARATCAAPVSMPSIGSPWQHPRHARCPHGESPFLRKLDEAAATSPTETCIREYRARRTTSYLRNLHKK